LKMSVNLLVVIHRLSTGERPVRGHEGADVKSSVVRFGKGRGSWVK